MKNYKLFTLAKTFILLLFLAGCSQNEDSTENPLVITDSTIDEEAGTQTITFALSNKVDVETKNLFSNARVADTGGSSATINLSDLVANVHITDEDSTFDEVFPVSNGAWNSFTVTVPLLKDLDISTYITTSSYNGDDYTDKEFRNRLFTTTKDSVIFFQGKTNILTPVAGSVELNVRSYTSVVDLYIDDSNGTGMKPDSLDIVVDSEYNISVSQNDIDTENIRYYFYEDLNDSEYDGYREVTINYVDETAGLDLDLLFHSGDGLFKAGLINNITVELQPADYDQGARITITGNDFSGTPNPITINGEGEEGSIIIPDVVETAE